MKTHTQQVGVGATGERMILMATQRFILRAGNDATASQVERGDLLDMNELDALRILAHVPTLASLIDRKSATPCLAFSEKSMIGGSDAR